MTTNITNTAKFFPAIGKNGKVSATAEKIAMTLNSVNRDGLTALARDGKGTIGAQARAVILGGAFGLPQLRVAEALSRDQWGNALALLVGEYGPQSFNRSTMRGRAGCALYLQAVERAALVRFDGAETVVAQDRAMKAVDAVRADLAHIQRLVAAVEADMMADRAAGIIAPAVDAPAVDAPAGDTPGAAWGWKAPAGGIARLADCPVTDAPVKKTRAKKARA